MKSLTSLQSSAAHLSFGAFSNKQCLSIGLWSVRKKRCWNMQIEVVLIVETKLRLLFGLSMRLFQSLSLTWNNILSMIMSLTWKVIWTKKRKFIKNLTWKLKIIFLKKDNFKLFQISFVLQQQSQRIVTTSLLSGVVSRSSLWRSVAIVIVDAVRIVFIFKEVEGWIERQSSGHP